MNSTRNYLKIRKYFELNDEKKKTNYTSNIRLLDSGNFNPRESYTVFAS